MLFPICQRYNFESKSQLRITRRQRQNRCFRYVKDTILKANHNETVYDENLKRLFPICQRYNFESKSQHLLGNIRHNERCFRYVKDTILKANHNR